MSHCMQWPHHFTFASDGPVFTLCAVLIWLQQLRADLQVRETRLREEMEAENRRLREELSRCQALLHEGEGQVNPQP